MMTEILTEIESKLPELSQAKRSVALFILENFKEIPFLSVTSMAQKIGVSDTTVIKFCMQMGYEGFGEFKKKISNLVQCEVSMSARLNEQLRKVDEESTLETVLAYDQNNLKMTLTNPTNRRNYQPLLELIENAHEIYIIGFRTSAVWVEYLSLTLTQQGLKAHAITPGLGDYIDRLQLATSKDLCIAINFTRYSTGVVKGVDLLKRHGVPCALITDSPGCPIYCNADLVFLCEDKSSHYSASFVGCLALINAITTGCLLRRKDKVAQNLKELDEAFQCFDTFIY